MQVWNVLHAACWKYMTQKMAKNSPPAHLRTTLSGHIFTYRQPEKNCLNRNISSTCPPQYGNFGPLTAKIVSGVWGTPANFNGFRFLPPLLHGTLVVDVEQRAPPIFGRAAITLGIGPHSSWICCIRNKNASGKTRTECVRTDQKILVLAVNVLIPSLMVVRLFWKEKNGR